MRSNSQSGALPIVTTTGANVAGPFDVGGAYEKFWLQLGGIAGSGTYILEGSLDGGTTWTDVTTTLTTPAGVAATSPLAASGLWIFPDVFPGLLRLRCTHVGTGTPTYALAYQDSRTV